MAQEDKARRIVVTGTSRGLGRAMAEGFAERGHTVAGCARNVEQIEQLRERFRPPHDFDVVDVTAAEAVNRWAKRILDSGDAPDLLINNAGLINANAPLWEVPPEEFSRVVDVNIKGVANVIRAFLPAMIGRGRGVVVNISSTWGRSVASDVAPYCATKWAVEGLTRALAQDLPRPLAAVPLNPGVIHTDMLESCFGDHASGFPTPREWAKQAVPFLLSLGPEHNGQPLAVGH